jgi:hypothetical protein
MDEFPIHELMGKNVLQMQEYLDENFTGHRIFMYGFWRGKTQFRIIGPDYNLTLRSGK